MATRRRLFQRAATIIILGMNTWESLGGSPPAPGTTGLFHTAILYPTRADLGDALRTAQGPQYSA